MTRPYQKSKLVRAARSLVTILTELPRLTLTKENETNSSL
jgi:hypothetical protein